MPLSDVNQSMRGGSKTRQWTKKGDPIGHSIQGKIVDGGKMPSINFETRQPEYWDNGDPKMMDFLIIQTTLNEGPDDNGQPDDGKRMVVLKGNAWTAGRDALVKAGALEKGFAEGGDFGIQFYAEGTPPRPGMNAPKLYQAYYVPPAVVPGGSFGPQPNGQSPVAQAPQVAPQPIQPQYQAPPQQAPQAPAPSPWPAQTPPAQPQPAPWPTAPQAQPEAPQQAPAPWPTPPAQ